MDGGGRRRDRRPRRSTTGTSASPPSATGPTAGRACSTSAAESPASSTTTSTCRSTSGRRCCPGSRRTTPTCTTRIVDADRASGGAIAQALQPHDPAAGQRARRPHPGALGPRRLRAPLRPPRRGHVAARDGGERPRAARPRRGGRALHDPRARPGERVARRRRRVADRSRRHDRHVPVVRTRRPTLSRRRRRSTTARCRTTSPSARPACRARTSCVAPSPRRATAASSCVATDGETFGHHHQWADRTLAYAFADEAAAAGVRVASAAAALLDERPPAAEVRVRESAWSCAHGVDRWRRRLRLPHRRRAGLEPGVARAAARRARPAPRRGRRGVRAARRRRVLRDPWAARDAYVDVLLGRRTGDEFLDEHASTVPSADDRVEALTLLEAQRNALLMYTSCGWFFNDLAGHRDGAGAALRGAVRRPARRARRVAAGRRVPRRARARRAATAPRRATGAPIWHRHVEPARVDADRVRRAPRARRRCSRAATRRTTLGGVRRRGPRAAPSSSAGRSSAAAGARRARGTAARGARDRPRLRRGPPRRPRGVRRDPPSRSRSRRRPVRRAVTDAVAIGERVTTVLRIIARTASGRASSASSPRCPTRPSRSWPAPPASSPTASSATYERLYDDHRPRLNALVAAGYPLPPELRAPAEFALAPALRGGDRRGRSTTDERRRPDAAQEIAARGPARGLPAGHAAGGRDR